MSTQGPKRFLLPVETAELATPALEAIAALTKHSFAKLDLLHVWEPIPFVPEEATYRLADGLRTYRAIATQEGERELRAVAKRAEQLGLSVGKQDVQEGAPAQTIVEFAEANDTDCIVLATHQRRGASRWLQGSVAEKVARAASCPVLSVPSR